MKRFLDIVSLALGILCHPLWMPTYGILVYCAAINNAQTPLPTAYWLIAVLATFTITAFVPLTLILVQIYRGTVRDLYIRDASERTATYVYSVVCYVFWCYFIFKVLPSPTVLFTIALGATIALILVLLINRKWKISAHLTGLGGLIGGILAYCYCSHLFPPVGLVCGLLCLALVLMYARLYTNAHTSLQVVAGLLLGLTCTFVPSLILELIKHA